MYRSPRKLYVTHEEFVRLQQLGQEYDLKRLIFNDVAEEEFAKKVSELTGVSKEILRRHVWHVEVVDVVDRRVGRNWTGRGGAHRCCGH